jgi:hypothetical protein
MDYRAGLGDRTGLFGSKELGPIHDRIDGRVPPLRILSVWFALVKRK